MGEKKKVLILCTGNSARSQMAEGLLKHITKGEYEVFSAGTKPSIVRSEAIKVLAEIDIDIKGNHSKSVDEIGGQKMDFVLTVCDNAKENCPFFPADVRLVHHSFEDPASVEEGSDETKVAEFRRVRDEIQDYLKNEFVQILRQEETTRKF
jgi:arsenate reductase